MSYNAPLRPPPYHATMCARAGCQNPCLVNTNNITYLFCSVNCAKLYQKDMTLTKCSTCQNQFYGTLCPYCSRSSCIRGSRQQRRNIRLESAHYSISVRESSPLLQAQYDCDNNNDECGDVIGGCFGCCCIILILILVFLAGVWSANHIHISSP
ncbi:hypothetical protein RclHR1_00070054 [Rhizophagus clarus]|uniref:Uncharacterized protein n=1 Tax=Rhizophagus clarus TaxID=94130 RepID=A0A2Z6SK06_9GLOM|nr:hypothetical protein RclHR1_00070054 [Rhizophagus clarus]GES78229.1 hypothetical protein GLOIN_2v1576591 [Rhizophagus clarus]